MTTIFERVNTALNSLSPSVSFALKPYEGDLPATFIEFELLNSPREQSADNIETERSYSVQVSIWDTTGLVSLPDVDTVMKNQGFQKATERQLPKDQQTGHFGIAKDYTYL